MTRVCFLSFVCRQNTHTHKENKETKKREKNETKTKDEDDGDEDNNSYTPPMLNTLRQRIGEPRLGGVRNERYLAMVERESTTNNIMQNINGEIPDVAG